MRESLLGENLFLNGGSQMVNGGGNPQMLSSSTFNWSDPNQRRSAVDYSGAAVNLWGQQSKSYINNLVNQPLVQNNSTFKTNNGPSLQSTSASEFFQKDLQ